MIRVGDNLVATWFGYAVVLNQDPWKNRTLKFAQQKISEIGRDQPYLRQKNERLRSIFGGIDFICQIQIQSFWADLSLLKSVSDT